VTPLPASRLGSTCLRAESSTPANRQRILSSATSGRRRKTERIAWERSVVNLPAPFASEPTWEQSSDRQSKQGEPSSEPNRTRGGCATVAATAKASKLTSAASARERERHPASRESAPASLAERPSCEGLGALIPRGASADCSPPLPASRRWSRARNRARSRANPASV
jgi:hypothetical protein